MTVGNISVKEVIIQDVEKRRQPSKHYVYRIKVSWSDGKIHLIYRRYSQFFSLQDALINLYPGESGASDPSKRIIPLLPGKILFGRSQIREVALRRKDLINEYLQKLIKLPPHVSKCELVIAFLTVTHDDVTESSSASDNNDKGAVKSAENISDPILLEQYVVIANFEKSDRNQVSLACGDTVEIIEKNDNGWWFVTIEDEHGWAPSSYLEPVDGTREDEGVVMKEVEKFICIKEYTAQQGDELPLKLGDIVIVTMKQRDGWWTVKLCVDCGTGKEGVVPAAHLRKFTRRCSAGEGLKDLPTTKNITAPPRQNTVKKVKRSKPQRPKPVQGYNNQAVASDNEEEVVYQCAKDYVEVDSGGTILNIKKGAMMTVLEKSPNGWWRVISAGQEGWIPSSVAQRKRRLKSGRTFDEDEEKEESVSKQKELFIATNSFTSSDEGVLSFEMHEVFEILDRDPNGWWFVKKDEMEGWAPSNYLKKYIFRKHSLQGLKVGSDSIDDSYENAVLPFQPPSDKTETEKKCDRPAKPSVPPKPKPCVRPKPVPKVAPRPLHQTVSEGNVHKEIYKGIKQKGAKPNRPDLPLGYDEVPIKPRAESTYSNIVGINFGNDNPETSGEIYVTVADYDDTDDAMLSFKAGQMLLVTQKEDNGWWFAEYGDQGGWVPSNYLHK